MYLPKVDKRDGPNKDVLERKGLEMNKHAIHLLGRSKYATLYCAIPSEPACAGRHNVQ